MSESELKQGDQAPDFDLPRDGGGRIVLSELRGKKVALYFYPKDDTPGCTKQAIDFSTQIAAFHTIGAEVIGISPDKATKHDKFRDKHNLKVILASDEDVRTCIDYGVWVEKKMYGRCYMGVERSVFLIDEGGVVRQVWRKVKPEGCAQAALTAIAEM